MSKRVLITGASEGLGRCFAQRFAREGYAVTAVARNESRLQSLLSELAGAAEHDYMVADLSTEQGQQLCMDRFAEQHYDVLINNAGFSFFGGFQGLEIKKEVDVMRVNIETTLKLTHAYLQTAQRGDAVINLSSLTYYLPTPIQASYVASKNWVAAFSESLWYQCRKQGIYVQCLCPGIAKTEFINRAGEVNYRSLLDFISVSPESVIDASYKALQKRKGPIVLPSIADKFVALMMKLLPRKATVWLMGKIGDQAL